MQDKHPKGYESAKCKGSMSVRFVPWPCTGSLPAPSRRKRRGVPTVLRTGSCSCQRCRTSRKARSHSAARRRTGSSACRTLTQIWSAGRSARPCSPTRSCKSACRPSWGLSRRRPTCRHHAPSFNVCIGAQQLMRRLCRSLCKRPRVPAILAGPASVATAAGAKVTHSQLMHSAVT